VTSPAPVSYNEARKRLLERIKNTGLPWPAPPKGYAEEYEFPLDPTELPTEEISRLLAQYAAWAGYATRLLAFVDAELTLLRQRVELAVTAKMAELEDQAGKRSLKDALRARAINEDPVLLSATQILAEKEAEAIILRAQKEIYEKHYFAMSRELSRRSDQVKSYSSNNPFSIMRQ